MAKYKSKFTGQQIDDGIEYAVRVTQQTLSSAQKQQARENIGVTPEVQVGGNTPASDSGVKLFVDENSDDTIEVYTKAQATGQFMVVVNSVSVPTASTLTYTSTDGTTKSFKVGDEIRVPDAEADNGYTFYKLYALTTESSVTTATWDKLGAGGGSTAGLEIVAASGTTLNAEVGKYYRYDSAVTMLTVTLPVPTDNSHACTIKFYFFTSSSPNVSFLSSLDVISDDNYKIVNNSVCEVTASYNGVKWVLSSSIVESGKVLLKLEKTLEDKSNYGRTTTTAGTVTPNYNNEYIWINTGYLALDTAIKDAITNKDYSLSLDVYPISTPAGSFFVFASMGGSNTEGGDLWFEPNNNKAKWYALGVRIEYTSVEIGYNKWIHVEWRKEFGTFKLLLNGIVVGTSSEYVTENAKDFLIGANQSSTAQTMNGYVKNIVIKLL